MWNMIEFKLFRVWDLILTLCTCYFNCFVVCCFWGFFFFFFWGGGVVYFFKIFFFKIILSGILSECQTVLIQTRTDTLLVLIWIQTVCKGCISTQKSGSWVKSSFSRSNQFKIRPIEIIISVWFLFGDFPLILFLFSLDYHLETTYPVNMVFVLKNCCLLIMSAASYLNAIETTFVMEAKHYEPSQNAISDHCRPASETPFKWRLAGGLIGAIRAVWSGSIFFAIKATKVHKQLKEQDNDCHE